MLKRLDALSFHAVRVLADGLHDPNPAIRLASAKEVLDRRFGKPRQEQTVDVRVSSMSEQHLQALKELAQAGLRVLPDQTQMIDVTPMVSEHGATAED